MQNQTVLCETDERGVARLTLNRPEKHNAFDDAIIEALIGHLERLGGDPAVRVLVLQAAGKHFSAGADLHWMKRMADLSHPQNERDARELARLMRTLNGLAKPTLAAVQGAAFGGALGLIACCDIAVASTRSKFALSEVKLGLAPAVISPYVTAAIGQRAMRRYCLTGERFGAERAAHLGLLHEAVAPEELEATVEGLIEQLLANGPNAVSACKALVARVAAQPLDDEATHAYTARLIADLRVSDEGQEGLGAFLEKREPGWRAPN